uniref:Citrate transport protein n=1 Tax=Timema shepardi TaxID=629360 RepID=A0A7R9B9F7_TIMSH|nr:unnamed protein product [Timema shepardi]
MDNSEHKTDEKVSAGKNGWSGGKAEKLNVKSIVTGAITGVISVFITYPIEYAKTQVQLEKTNGREKLYKGTIDCVTKTVKTYGFKGLYKGLNVLVYGSIPRNAILFGSYDTTKSLLVKDHGHATPKEILMCGLFAGVCEAILIVTPMEVIKVTFINDNRLAQPRYKSFSHGVKTIACDFGIRNLYKGLAPTIVRQGSNQAIRFFVMETGKERYRKGDPSVHVPKAVVGLIGVLAGATSVLVNNPVDVVKTRMQGLESHKYKNTVDCFSKIWRLEGTAAFYKGLIPRFSRACMEVAITFMVFDSYIDMFDWIWPDV